MGQKKEYKPLSQATPTEDWAYQPVRKIDFNNQDTIKKFEEWRKNWGETINKAAQFYNVKPSTIYAMIYQESGGNPNARSSAGPYYGLLQVENGSFDPHKNIWQGMSALRAKEDGIRWVMDNKYQPSEHEVLGAYNWGQGNWGKYVRGKKDLPEETRRYIADINYNAPMFEQWLSGQKIVPPPTGYAPQNRPIAPLILEAPPMNMPIMTPDKTRVPLKIVPLPVDKFEDFNPNNMVPMPREGGGYDLRNMPRTRGPMLGIER